MKTLLGITLIAITVAGFSACDEPVKPMIESFTYPLALGNTWIYEMQVVTDYRGKKQNDTLKYSVTAKIDYVDTLLPGIQGYVLTETNTDTAGFSPSDRAMYVNLPEGFYRVEDLDPGHEGQGRHALPKKGRGEAGVIFAGRRHQSLADLFTSLTGTANPVSSNRSAFTGPFRLVLPYPQTLGQPWVMLPKDHTRPFEISKHIIGDETIKVATGWLDCHVIGWIYDPPLEGLEVVELIAPEGLVRREFTLHNLVVPTYQNPAAGDTVDSYISLELKSFEIQ